MANEGRENVSSLSVPEKSRKEKHIYEIKTVGESREWKF